MRTKTVDQVLSAQPWNHLRPALDALGVDVERTIVHLKSYARMLLEWNRTASNLIGRADEVRLVERHLLESLEHAGWLRESGATRWLDFGSGGGLPAIPLALVGVGPNWTLVESRRSKTLFLRKFIQESGLRGIEVINERLENLVGSDELRVAFDGFTSRATLSLAPTLAMAREVVKPGGQAFLWKGSGRDDEMKKDTDWTADWRLIESRNIGTGPGAVLRFERTS